MGEFDSIIKNIRSRFGFWSHPKGGEVKYTNAVLIFAFNGTGKTRLSYEFAHKDRVDDQHHTLYYNAFTEDLFTWNNDLEHDSQRYMVINTDSQLIQGLNGYPYDDGINKYLSSLTGFKAHFESNEHDDQGNIIEHPGDTIPREVWFSRSRRKKVKDEEGKVKLDEAGAPIYEDVDTNYIKVSRGEERLFVWCVFRYIMELVLTGDKNFETIKYIYIDDPMSSLDDNNIIRFTGQLTELINVQYDMVMDRYKDTNVQDDLGKPMFIISTHHTLFYNTLRNNLKSSYGFSLWRDRSRTDGGWLRYDHLLQQTPVFYHLSMLAQIKQELEAYDKTGICRLQKYHFNVLRGIIEQLAQIMGQRKEGSFGRVLDGIKYHFDNEEYTAEDEGFEQLSANAINAMSHSGTSLLESTMLSADGVQIIRDIYDHLVSKYDLEVPTLENQSAGSSSTIA